MAQNLKDIVVFVDHLLSFLHLILCQRESHIFAEMIVFHYANAHSFIGGNFFKFRYIDVVQIVHSHWLFVSFVVGMLSNLNLNPMVF